MHLITILTEVEQLQVCTGSWQETLNFLWFLENSPNCKKFKITDSERNLIGQKKLYFEQSTKWVEKLL